MKMGMMEYSNFGLLITRVGKKYRGKVLKSQAGDATSEFSMPFSKSELKDFFQKLNDLRGGVHFENSSAMTEIKAFGSRLFDTVIQGRVRECFFSRLQEIGKENGLRLLLDLTNAPKLVNLPWEYLYNTSHNNFLSHSVETPIVRYLELPVRFQPLAIKPPLKVLVMISSPDNYPQLNVEQEWEKLNEAFRDLIQLKLVTVELLEAPILSTLQKHLQDKSYHIFHYIGHGIFDEQVDDSFLVMEDENKQGQLVDSQRLATLLHDKRHSLRLVLLNACEGARSSLNDPFTGVAQNLVQKGIPAVIAMQLKITDDAAIILTHKFYETLAGGFPVDAALTEARKAIYL